MDSIRAEYIINKALEFSSSSEPVALCDDPVINKIVVNSYKVHPHLFVLCCLMDRQIEASKAWRIPFDICDILGTRELKQLNDVSETRYIKIFEKNHFHRYNKKMALTFKSGLDRIDKIYDGDAAIIWKGSPHSALVISRFLEFDGCGIKIATMATNLLHRALGVPFSDYSSIDVSPDVHILRVMYRLGLISDRTKRELAIYSARGLYPSYPGIIDPYFWRLGKDYCHNADPICDNCPLKDICPKIID